MAESLSITQIVVDAHPGEGHKCEEGGGTTLKPFDSSIETDASSGESPIYINVGNNPRRRPDRLQSISDRYYGMSTEVGPGQVQFSESFVKTFNTKQSRRIPPWIWLILAKTLGIKMHPGDKPIIGTLVYGITLTAGFAFGISATWYKMYDIASSRTKETVLSGMVSIITTIYWISIGIYGFHLSGKLFDSRIFVNSVRMHSKTIYKLNAAGIMIFMGVVLISVDIYQSIEILFPEHCERILLHQSLCQVMFISRCISSVLSLVWNLLIVIVVLSVCRTHTISIRRFIQDLDKDGKTYENQHREKMLSSRITENDVQQNDEMWREVLSSDSLDNDRQLRNRNQTSENVNYEFNQSEPLDVASLNNNLQRMNNFVANDTNSIDQQSDSIRGQETLTDHILTNDEILIGYWKINTRLRTTSIVLQRWLSALIILILLWDITQIIWWFKHEPTWSELIEFIIPLLILPLICSAYGEVNYEGKRVIRNICPTDNRVYMLFYLAQQPLELNVFGFAINYSTIITALSAIGVAMLSRIILDEIKV